jgi:HK97 family phage portal protein
MAATKKKSAPKPRKRSLAPKTEPSDPERRMMFVPPRQAGVIVTEETALTQSAVWACIRVISESLAGMPWNVGHRANDGTIDKLNSHPLEWLLNFQPNEETEAFTFREVMWAWALGWGNGYAEIERDLRGEPVALWQIPPWRVRLLRDENGRLVYEVLNDMNQPTYLYARDMFHLKGPSPDGLVGWSVIRMHARTIGLAIAQEKNASTFNENDSTPGGLLKFPAKLSESAVNNLRTSWERRHAGPENRRKVAVLEEGGDWVQTSIDPNDAKLVEQMQLTPSMICRIFRVPPHKIADLTRSTNNNIEHQDLEFVKDTLRPWAERGEGEADVKLFGRNNQGRLVTFIDMLERERGDSAAQTTHVKEMIFTGVYSVNEGRRYLGLKSIGPEGDVRFIQSAMLPLDVAGKQTAEPAPQPEPQSDDEPESDAPSMDEGDDLQSEYRASALAVVEDACRRLLNRETKDCQKLTGDALVKWMDQHREYGRKALAPGVRSLAACYGVKSEQARHVALEAFLVAYIQGTEGPQQPEAMAIRLVECLKAAKGAA